MLRAVDDLLVKKEIRLHMDHEPLSRAYVAYKDMLLDMDHLGWFSEAVKQRYEDVLIEKLYVLQYGDKARDQCFDDTYGRGRWLRRLFYFAQEDVVYASSKHRFNKLVHDWKQFKKDMNIQSRPLELWERLPDYIHGTEDEKPGPVQPPAAPVVINNSNTAPSSSLQHVYFFINSQTSSPDTQAATDHDLV
jgi:hypothetical protein